MIACVIANYNGKELLRRCLSSLPDCLAIVVDNNSTDLSQDMVRREFPNVKLISLSENIGTAAYNYGISYALSHDCDYIFLGSNDLVFTDNGIFEKLVSQFESVSSINLGIVAPDQLMPDGSRSSTGNKVSSFRLTTRPSESNELDYAWNCMVKKEVFERVGLIDPSYFAYWEDVDLGARAKKAGFTVLALHETCLYHVGSATSDRVQGLKGYMRLRNKLLYSKRNHSAFRRFYDCVTVTLELPLQLFSRRNHKDLKVTLLGYFHGMAIMFGLKEANIRPWGPVRRD